MRVKATVVVCEYKGGWMILLIRKNFYNLDQVSLKAQFWYITEMYNRNNAGIPVNEQCAVNEPSSWRYQNSELCISGLILIVGTW